MRNVSPYDALMLVSYGGPSQSADVLPFLRNATGGAGIPQERLLQVAHHYERFGGVSPINARNQELLAGLRARLGEGLLYGIGNRNWHPYFTQTLTDLAARGARRILTLFTAAYTSYSGCRQYRENLAAAISDFHSSNPGVELRLDRVRPFANTPGFVQANVHAIHEGLVRLASLPESTDSASLPQLIPPATHLVYVTHSIPVEMARNSGPRETSLNHETNVDREMSLDCETNVDVVDEKPALFADRPYPVAAGRRCPDLPPLAFTGLLAVTRDQNCLGTGWTYLAQHLAVINAVNRHLAAEGIQLPWSLAFCSRSGSPRQQWLEPDINTHLTDLAKAGVKNVIVAPIGFISDHMEVVYDLDTEAVQTAHELGLNYQRVATAGSYSCFLDQLADLVVERAALARGENIEPAVEGATYPPLGENCGPDCCRYPRKPAKHPYNVNHVNHKQL